MSTASYQPQPGSESIRDAIMEERRVGWLLDDFIAEGGGVQEAQFDLMPMLEVRLDQSPNGVLNALRKGVSEQRVGYAVGSSEDVRGSAKKITKVWAIAAQEFEQPKAA